MAILEQIKVDLQGAMRAGEKERVGALRLVLSELQKAAKEGGDDELAAIVEQAVRDSGASSAKDMGTAMRQAMAAVDGRADGKRVSELVRAALQG